MARLASLETEKGLLDEKTKFLRGVEQSNAPFIRYKTRHRTTIETIQKAVATPRRQRIWGLYFRMLYLGTLPMSVLASGSLEPSGLRCSRIRYCTSHP